MDAKDKRDIVRDIREAHDHFVQALRIAGGDTSDLEEKLDEVEVGIFVHAGIEFVRCHNCDEDELVEDARHLPETTVYVCTGCWDERLRS